MRPLYNTTFRKASQLYSGSFDRTLKVYDLSRFVIRYVETLLDHDHVLGLNDRCWMRQCTAASVNEMQFMSRGESRSQMGEVLERWLNEDYDG